MAYQIKFRRCCKEWHPQSSPYIVDDNDLTVVQFHQFVDHPGEYDAEALRLAQITVKALNGIGSVNTEPV
jgi:hypothetical protein